MVWRSSRPGRGVMKAALVVFGLQRQLSTGTQMALQRKQEMVSCLVQISQLLVTDKSISSFELCRSKFDESLLMFLTHEAKEQAISRTDSKADLQVGVRVCVCACMRVCVCACACACACVRVAFLALV